MKVWIRTFFLVSTLYAADPQQLTVVSKAQSDFDKVELAPLPSLADTANCVQSQAAAVSVSQPEEASLLYFRRGYCALAGAAITSDTREYAAATADFQRAIGAWPMRMRKTAKRPEPEPVSSALRILPWVAQLRQDPSSPVRTAAREEIASALDHPACMANLMPASQCEQILQTGREWLGWIALGDGKLDDAARYFAGTDNTGWPEWVEGQQQFQKRNYAEAVAREQRAISIWKSMWQGEGPTLVRRLGPAPDLPVALAELGGAQLLAGDARGAIATLDASLKLSPSNPQALYRRARAHEMAGEKDAALTDYGMASRAAFASAKDLASGEAHLYRGILMYRRREFGRAEDEFSSALNFEIPETLRADAQAWRHMAAVAGGSCISAREFLDRTLPEVSPYFPKQEARQIATECSASAKTGAR